MISPQQDFAERYGKQWPDVVDSAMFRAAAAAALNTLVLNQSSRLDAEHAVASHYRVEGAKQFLSTLMSLADPTGEFKSPSNQNLNHRL